MSPAPFRVLAPVLFLLSALGAPHVLAHHHDGEEAASAEAAAPAEAQEEIAARAAATPPGAASADAISVDGMPVNDAAAFGTSISAPDLAPAVSLHTTAKILNNSSVSNELKEALKANALEGPAPSVAPPPQDHLGAAAPDAAALGESVPEGAARPAEDIRFDVAPAAARAAEPASGAAPAPGARAGGGGPGLGVALVLIALAGLGGGYYVSRRMRSGQTRA